MSITSKSAAKLHENVPPGWYHYSIQRNIFQKFVHTSRFKEVGKLIELTGGKILDIGCADGEFTNVIYKKSKADKIIAIDILPSNIKWAKKKWAKNKHIEFRIGDAHKLNFPTNNFDAVFALEVLEHVFEPEKVLREIRRVLKRNGYAVFLVPAETLLFQIIWFFWTNYYVGKVWNHTHLHAYKNNYLVELAKKTGFKVEVDKKIIFGCLHLIKVRKIR